MKKAKTTQDIYRVIDANFNRAREGLRVIEDTVRFVQGDESNFKKVRSLRHMLSLSVKEIYPKLVDSRDSAGDFGKETTERKHASVKNIMLANFSRVEESLRVLEEYSRLVSKGAAKHFKGIRFKVYILEKKLNEQK